MTSASLVRSPAILPCTGACAYSNKTPSSGQSPCRGYRPTTRGRTYIPYDPAMCDPAMCPSALYSTSLFSPVNT